LGSPPVKLEPPSEPFTRIPCIFDPAGPRVCRRDFGDRMSKKRLMRTASPFAIPVDSISNGRSVLLSSLSPPYSVTFDQIRHSNLRNLSGRSIELTPSETQRPENKQENQSPFQSALSQLWQSFSHFVWLYCCTAHASCGKYCVAKYLKLRSGVGGHFYLGFPITK
jgi:hypothetical protein